MCSGYPPLPYFRSCLESPSLNNLPKEQPLEPHLAFSAFAALGSDLMAYEEKREHPYPLMARPSVLVKEPVSSRIKQTASHFLFEHEARDIPTLSKLSEEAVNHYLRTLMSCIAFFLSKGNNEGFTLLDPSSGNNQCHLFSLFAAKAKQQYNNQTQEEKLAYTDQNRFLFLSFFLNLAFTRNSKLLPGMIEKAITEKEFSLPEGMEAKQFTDFISKYHQQLIPFARKALNQVFQKQIQENLAKEAAERGDDLHRELYQLSLEDLSFPSTEGKKGNSLLYTLPKLAGVAYLIHQTCAIVFKTKVITSEGNASFIYTNKSNLGPTDPVIVFEAVASNKSLENLMKLGSKCSSFFDRVPSKQRPVHLEPCEICHDKVLPEEELVPYRLRFEKLIQSTPTSLYALGADFMNIFQKPFLKFFNDEKKYPILADIFQKAIADIETFGISSTGPTFNVVHVHLDTANYALASKFRMDFSPEEFLKERNFL